MQSVRMVISEIFVTVLQGLLQPNCKEHGGHSLY